MNMTYLRNVASLRLDRDACTGCGICATVCPHGVFRIVADRAEIAELDACMECGACARNCPANALKVNAGVGCATGILNGLLRGGNACCGEDGSCCGG